MFLTASRLDLEPLQFGDATLVTHVAQDIEVRLVPTFLATLTAPDWGHRVTLQLGFATETAQYAIESLTVAIDEPERTPHASARPVPEISSAFLRTIRVSELHQAATPAGVYLMLGADSERVSLAEWPRAEAADTSANADVTTGNDDDLVDMSSISIASFIAERIERDPSPSSFRPIVMTYQVAHLCSHPPAKSVEAQYGLAPRTAARWIARAKELGLLTTPAVEQLGKLDG